MIATCSMKHVAQTANYNDLPVFMGTSCFEPAGRSGPDASEKVSVDPTPTQPAQTGRGEMTNIPFLRQKSDPLLECSNGGL